MPEGGGECQKRRSTPRIDGEDLPAAQVKQRIKNDAWIWRHPLHFTIKYLGGVW